MSYYPTERRGGCMESLSRCCRQAYVYPLDARKLLYAGGAVVGLILVAVIWSSLSSSGDSGNAEPFKGSSILHTSPLIVGCNFFPLNLRDLVHNNVSKFNFNQNLKNDSVFGDKSCSSCQTDLSRLESGLVASQIWSISVPCDAMYKDTVALTLEQLDAVSRLISSYPTHVTAVHSSDDIGDSFRTKKLGSIISVTSGHSMDGRMAVLRTFKQLGVKVMAIASECNVSSWAPSYEEVGDPGLSEFGKAVVKEMNRLGIVIDLSHLSHQAQLDVLNVTKAPVIFSHAAAYNLTNNVRNIQDDVLVELSKNKGLLMVTFAQKYVSSVPQNATIASVIDHINYIKGRYGFETVGIGGEFDAKDETYPALLGDVSSFPTLFDQLGNSWTNHEELKSLAGGNFLRVLQAVEKYAEDVKSLPVDETFNLQYNSSCYSDYSSRKIPEPTTTQMPVATTASTKVTTTHPPITTPTTQAPTTTKAPSNTTVTPSTTTPNPAPKSP